MLLSPPPSVPRQQAGQFRKQLNNLLIIAKSGACSASGTTARRRLSRSRRVLLATLAVISRHSAGVDRYRAFQRCLSRGSPHHIAITARLSRMHHPPANAASSDWLKRDKGNASRIISPSPSPSRPHEKRQRPRAHSVETFAAA